MAGNRISIDFNTSSAIVTLNAAFNVHGVNDPVKLARMIEPELARLARLAR